MLFVCVCPVVWTWTSRRAHTHKASVKLFEEAMIFPGTSVRSSISEADDDSSLSPWSVLAGYHGKRFHQHARNHFSMISCPSCQVMLPYFIADQIGLDFRLGQERICRVLYQDGSWTHPVKLRPLALPSHLSPPALHP